MKKVVSYTLATTLAASAVSSINIETIKAEENNLVESNIDIVNTENTIEVENTEKIGEELLEEKVEENSQETVDENSEETVDVTPDETMEEAVEEILIDDTNEIEEIKSTEASGKVLGKLEIDMNFSMPLKNTDNELFNVTLKNEEEIKVQQVIGQETSGKLDSGITYNIEKFNYKRQSIEEGEDVYYIKITFENLDLGVYSLDIDGAGYTSALVENIEIVEYNQRVKIGNADNNLNEVYNGVFLAGDINKDTVINMEDYTLVFDKLGSNDSNYDLNRDGAVDIADLTYVNSNIGKSQGKAEIISTDKIINLEEVQIDAKDVTVSGNLNDIFTSVESTVQLSKNDGAAPTKESPLTLDISLGNSNARSSQSIEMESIIIKAPESISDENSAMVSEGYITYTDAEGNKHQVAFNENNKRSNGNNEDIVIDLGNQIAVKEISINVTANRGNKNISQIAKIEFLNNVYKELPQPEMNIPQIKTVETCTNLHDERITLSWEPQPNVTAYEVKYEKLDNNGNVIKTKKLQTNDTKINILDKEIKSYDIYRVSIQSLNGEWSSGYEDATKVPIAFDGIADNVDENYNPKDEYYNGDKGTVSEIQVIPIQSPEPPRNLTTKQGFKSFTVSWEQHSQARDFDIYYRKIGDTNKSWIKANENKIEVTEDSPEVTNPNKDTLVRSHSYTINGLEHNTAYEVKVTATNHLGTSNMSESYIASTVSVTPPTMSAYKLINRATEDNEIGTTNIIDVRNKLDEDGWETKDDYLKYDSEYALVDGDFTTTWEVNNWDTGAEYKADRGSEITFNDTYTIGSIGVGLTLEDGYNINPYKVKITYWDENGDKQEEYTQSIEWKKSNDRYYLMVTLNNPITTNKIKVDFAGYGGTTHAVSELKFYEYDSIADDIKDLYEDDLRMILKDSVTQEQLNKLLERLNTADPISNEYHPNQEILLKELDTAQKLFNDKKVSEKITKLDASIRTDNVGPSLGMENSWQSLGSVAKPGIDEEGTAKQIAVYMGSTDKNTKVDIVFLQNYGMPGQYISRVYTISPGRTEITIPEIISANVEKGGQVMARVTAGSTEADVQIRLSGVTEIPNLNVNNIINDSSKVDEVKENIKTYISTLKAYVKDIENQYPSEASEEDNKNNIYLYDETTSILNTTDIEGDRFTLTLPATEILKGIQEGLNGDENAEIERVYNALLAWEQEIKVAYAKKGVFEEVQDFNGNGEIDSEDNAYFNKHKAPLTRLNVKYQRMMMGAAAYASSHHIGVGFNSSEYIQGVPYKFDENNNVINEDEAKLYGVLMGHEIGHAMDIGDRIYAETSNNLLAAITGTMTNEDSPYVGAFREVYEKVTSNTIGLSTDRQVVLNMLWQPYLAYEDDSTYKMLFTDSDADLSNDSYFAKLNRAYREMTAEERADGDRDQWLIRMTSKVVGKNLTSFYEAHGIIANATTLEYVSQFEEETRPIQYINDEARRQRLAGTADMAEETKLNASFANDSEGNIISNGSYVNEKSITIDLSVSESNENILGYEIYRNGEPCGFVERDKTDDVTSYVDVVDSMNNRVATYSAVAYDYNLNATEKIEIGTIKIRHDGGIAKSSTILTTNTVSIHEENNDIHSCEGNSDLKLALDDDTSTAYIGRMLEKSEYNSSVHESTMNPNNDPYLLLDTTEIKTLVGIKYTAATETSGLIFKKSSVLDSTLKKYKIEVSKDGINWTVAKEGTLSLDAQNPEVTIYFDEEGVSGGNQLNSYNARYVKITALGTKEISASEIELITPPGDNIEIGISDDNINYSNGIGILKEDYVYVEDDINTEADEERFIPAGSIVITGEYRGNPAFNVPLVLNQDEEHIADKYKGILLAEVPDNGDLKEIAEGNWIYWVEPEYAENFINNNTSIFAELYRTDTADASEGGQRLVSDTFKLNVPTTLPEITLSTKTRNSKVTAIDISKELINKVSEKR